MKIHVCDITDSGSELDFTEAEPWVKQAVARVDEQSAHDPKQDPAVRPIKVHLDLRKVDEIVVISGQIATHVNLLCSRCGIPFHFDCADHFSGLYSTDPEMAGVAHLEGEGKPKGQNRGFARHAHDSYTDGEESTSESSETLGKELDITFLARDFIDLGDVLTEQLGFQIPLQPICKESCKGVCLNCGTDLNENQCECSKKVNRNNAFSALENLKL